MLSVVTSVVCGSGGSNDLQPALEARIKRKATGSAEVVAAGGATEPNVIESRTQDSGEAGIGSRVSSAPDGSVPVGVGVTINKVYFASVGELAWASTASVAGTVAEVRTPQFIEGIHSDRPTEVPSSDTALIFTDYVILVDHVYRGQQQNEVVIRQQGGTIGNVTVMNMPEPEMKVGQQGLFFLQPVIPIGGETDAAFVSKGTWWIDGQNLIPMTPPNSDEHPPVVQMEAMMSEIAEALRGEPLGSKANPVSDAPLGPDLR